MVVYPVCNTIQHLNNQDKKERLNKRSCLYKKDYITYEKLKHVFLSLQCLKRLAEYVNEQNQSVFVPRGLMIVNPMERGLRVVSFHEFYLVFTACITIEFLLT